MRKSEHWSSSGRGAIALAIAAGVLLGCGGEDPVPQAPVEHVEAALVAAPGNCGSAVAETAICACMDANFIASPGRPCMIFSGADINGGPSRFFMNLGLAPYTVLNDQISSIWTGPGARARVCTNPGGAGTCATYPANTTFSNLAGTPFQDSISSIRVDPAGLDCMNPGQARMSFFEDANFKGDCVVLNWGDYPNPFTNATSFWSGGGFGLRDNTISSSIFTSPLMHYTLWDQANFLGTHRSFLATVGNFATATDFNDRTTSMVVDSCSHDLCAPGPALGNVCGTCAENVCANDPFCCDANAGQWDSICVSEVPTFCASMSCS